MQHAINQHWQQIIIRKPLNSEFMYVDLFGGILKQYQEGKLSAHKKFTAPSNNILVE